MDVRLDAIHWRPVDDRELYWLDDVVVPTPPRDVQHPVTSRAVTNYLKQEEELCRKNRAEKRKASTAGLPPCPCVSSDLRTSFHVVRSSATLIYTQ